MRGTRTPSSRRAKVDYGIEVRCGRTQMRCELMGKPTIVSEKPREIKELPPPSRIVFYYIPRNTKPSELRRYAESLIRKLKGDG